MVCTDTELGLRLGSSPERPRLRTITMLIHHHHLLHAEVVSLLHGSQGDGQLHVFEEWIPGLGCCTWHIPHRYVHSPHKDAPECGGNLALGELPTIHRWGNLFRDVGDIGSSTRSFPLEKGGNPRLLAGC